MNTFAIDNMSVAADQAQRAWNMSIARNFPGTDTVVAKTFQEVSSQKDLYVLNKLFRSYWAAVERASVRGDKRQGDIALAALYVVQGQMDYLRAMNPSTSN